MARALPVESSDEGAASIDLTANPEVLSEEFGKRSEHSPFLNSGVHLAGVAYTMKTKAKFSKKPALLGDVLVPDHEVPSEYWIRPERLPEWEYLKGAKSVQRTHAASGTSYAYAEGRMAFPDLTTRPSRTILTGEGGTSPSRFKHVIETSRGFRRLVPKELERLNGFPDDWTRFADEGVEIGDGRRAFFMGNALVVGLIERVGQVLAEDTATS